MFLQRSSFYVQLTFTVPWLVKSHWFFIQLLWLCAWKKDINAFVVLPGAYIWRFDSYFNLSPMYHLYVSYLSKFHSKLSKILSSNVISCKSLLFTMQLGFFNRGSFIVHALLPGTSKAFTLLVFLPGAHAFMSCCWGTWRYACMEEENK